MKNLKRLFFIISIFAIFNISAFAKSGSEFILNVPIGASYSIISENMKDYKMKNSFGFDVGVNAQFGGMFQNEEGFGISLLGDIGYSHDSYKIKYEGNYVKDYSYRYDSIQVGLLTKLKIKKISIGIGGGVKFPIFSYFEHNYNKNYSSSSASYSIQTNPNDENNTSGEENGWYDHVYYGDGYGYYQKQKSYYVIPYIKLTLDYSVFFTQKWAINIGLYCRYDFLPERELYYYNNYNHYYEFIKKPKNYGTLNFGVQLGLRFAPKA